MRPLCVFAVLAPQGCFQGFRKTETELLWKLVKNVGDNLQSGVFLGRWHREGVGCRKH